MKITLNPIVFLLLLFLGSNPAKADFYLHRFESRALPMGALRIQEDALFVSTNQNFQGSGGLGVPSGLKAYNRMQSSTRFDFGLSDRITVSGRLSWAWIQVQAQSGGSGSGLGSAFGLTDQAANLEWRITPNEDPDTLRISLGAQLDLPAYSNSNAIKQSTPFLGDGSVDMTGGVFMTLPLHWGTKTVSQIKLAGGYTYRTFGFSQALPWSFSLSRMPRSEGFGGEVGVEGFLSLENDTFVGQTGSTRSALGGGGSFFVNAINPSLVSTRIKLAYAMSSSFSLHVTALATLAGTKAPSFFGGGLGLEIKLGDSPKSGRPKTPGTGIPNTFQSYTMVAQVIDVKDTLHLVKINKGSAQGVKVGDSFELFSNSGNRDTIHESIQSQNQGQENRLVAKAQCTHTRADEAVLRITEYVEEDWIQIGNEARRTP